MTLRTRPRATGLGPRGLAGTALLAVILGATSAALPAQAAELTVPCTGAGGGPAGLVQAVNDANAAPGPDTISLAPGCTYTLVAPHNADNGLPVVTGKLSILGRRSTIRRTSTTPFRILQVAPGADVAVDRVTLAGGAVSTTGTTAYGGAILNRGTLAVRNTQIVGNSVTGNPTPGLGGGAGGGGVANEGTLVVTDSVLRNNSATASGVIFAVAVGGGIINRTSATTTIRNSLIEANSATATATSSQGFIAAAGGAGSTGTMTISTTNVVANRVATVGPNGAANGGGVSIGLGTLTMTSSSIRANSATAIGPGSSAHGGGLESYGETVLVNSVVTANRAVAPAIFGGGIYNGFELVLLNTLVTANVPDNCNPPQPGCPA